MNKTRRQVNLGMKDTHTLLLTMSERNPFAESTSLRRYSVSSCVATHRFSLTTHSYREHHRKPFWTRLPPDIAGPTGEVQHVLNGGALLHRITWLHGFPTYQEVCALYGDHVSRNFGPAIVVFDGYRIPSTKYTTHQRRSCCKVGIYVTFTGDMKFSFRTSPTNRTSATC